VNDPESREPAGAEPDPGVLGSLPRRRPGVRSPRREEASARASRRSAGDPEPPEPSPESGSGVEDLVRAGAAVATEAAAVGLRLAGHALRGIRGAAGRR
jgi:hypothetical protein